MRNDIGIPPLSDDERERGARETKSHAPHAPHSPHAHGPTQSASRSDVIDSANPIRQHMREVERSTRHDDRAHQVNATTHDAFDDEPTRWNSGLAWTIGVAVACVGLVFLVAYFANLFKRG
jgi:hypothetical protein